MSERWFTTQNISIIIIFISRTINVHKIVKKPVMQKQDGQCPVLMLNWYIKSQSDSGQSPPGHSPPEVRPRVCFKGKF